MTRNLGDRACHFHAGGAAADDGKREQTLPLGLVVTYLGTLEREKDSPARLRRVVDPFHSRSKRGPFVVSKIRVRRPRGDDKIVVADATLGRLHVVRCGVDGVDFRHQHRRVLLACEHVPYRPRHVRWRQRGGRDLIEKRLEAMVILPVDDDNVDRNATQSLRGLDPAEPCADDDHAWSSDSFHGVVGGTRRIANAARAKPFYQPRNGLHLFVQCETTGVQKMNSQRRLRRRFHSIRFLLQFESASLAIVPGIELHAVSIGASAPWSCREPNLLSVN